MRESRTYGSVRGARGNSRPYRDRSEIREPRTSRAPHGACMRLPARALHPGYYGYYGRT
jgi:hypothetical protein